MGSATSYLWGSSSTNQNAENINSNNNNNNTKSKHFQSTASLTDLPDLNNEEKEFSKSYKNRHSITHSQSLQQISYHQKQSSLFKTPPIQIILDKDSKHKLSATSSISFLFNTKKL